MALLVITGGLLLALCLVLFTVRHLRPRRFRLKATLTKWASLDLEMESPEPMSPTKTTAQPRARTTTDVQAPRHTAQSALPPTNGGAHSLTE
jgi:hypothetical protein